VQSVELNFSFASFLRAPVLFQLRFYDAPDPVRAVKMVRVASTSKWSGWERSIHPQPPITPLSTTTLTHHLDPDGCQHP
jgi:hypothetical protein